jgi:hypothetical protein
MRTRMYFAVPPPLAMGIGEAGEGYALRLVVRQDRKLDQYFHNTNDFTRAQPAEALRVVQQPRHHGRGRRRPVRRYGGRWPPGADASHTQPPQPRPRHTAARRRGGLPVDATVAGLTGFGGRLHHRHFSCGQCRCPSSCADPYVVGTSGCWRCGSGEGASLIELQGLLVLIVWGATKQQARDLPRGDADALPPPSGFHTWGAARRTHRCYCGVAALQPREPELG